MTSPLLLDDQPLRQDLLDHGLGKDHVDDKARRFAAASQTLGTSTPATLAFFVPGRIEVLGKHTDYCGGHSLVTAVECGFCVVARPRTDNVIRVHALDEGDHTEFRMGPELDVPTGTWTNYPMTVARRLARNFDSCRTGADIAFSSDLPSAAGMSSSSALLIATYLILAEVNQLESTDRFREHVVDDLTRAEYLGTHENGQSFGQLAGDRGVGTFGGSEDHTAILCSQRGYLGLYRYCPTQAVQQIRLPEGLVFAVGASGVVAEKTGAAQELYNRASLRVQALVHAWQRQQTSSAVYLADITSGGDRSIDQMRAAIEGGSDGFDTQELSVRLDHFLAEERLLEEATDALARGDVATFGECVDRSQELTDRLLGNQVPETRDLARLAREQGALAASAFGAGFGGSVWALTSDRQAEEFTERWRRAYVDAYPVRGPTSQFFLTGSGPAAFPLHR